jgi:Flp pilus assembly protein TadD
MRLILLFCLIVSIALPASAAEKAEEKKDIPYRLDRGLTKTEYLLFEGQFSAAIDEAGSVLARHPADPDAYTYRGFAYMKLGETAKAAENFRKALEVNPTHLGANKYLADTYLADGNVARAIEQLQVIRMTCGHADCEEQRALEAEIDKFKKGDLPVKEDKK